MHPPNSSTSSSEEAAGVPPEPPFSFRKLGRTTLFFFLVLALFELATWAIFTKAHLSGGALRRFLWYGTSYEVKLRELVNTPDLPPNSILYAGWINERELRKLPTDVDVTVYGMSFSGHLADAMHELRPQQSQRVLGGPASPLSHSYATYQLDKGLRKTRFAIIGVTSGGVGDVVLMNHGSLYADRPFPYFFPRFKLDHGKAVRAADSLINSPEELRVALDEKPELWRRQLDILAANDPLYHRFLFASDPLDASVLGRFVRRGLSKHQETTYVSRVLGPHGYQLKEEAPQLFRAILRQMVGELRAENVHPIVALFSFQGQGDHLYELVRDILAQDQIPYVDTNADCSSDDRANYLPDMHFVHDCDLKFAARTLETMDRIDQADRH
jgi:hypothetical protein